jgi:dienelactone hydrolase
VGVGIILAGALALATGVADVRADDRRPPALEVYGDLPAIEQVDLSLDGGQVAIIRRRGGERYLVAHDLAAGTDRFVRLGPGKVRGLLWVDADHLLVIASKTGRLPGLRDNERREALTATLVNLADGAANVLFADRRDYYSIVLGWPRVVTRDGKAHLYVVNQQLDGQSVAGQFSNPALLFDIDLATGKPTVIPEGGVNSRAAFYYDWLYGPDGTMVARALVKAPGTEWQLEMWLDGAWKPVMTRQLKLTSQTVRPELVGMGRNGASVLIRDAIPEDRDGAGAEPQMHYYELSSTGAVSEALDPPYSNYSPIFHPRTWRLAGFAYRADAAEEDSHVFYDDSLKLLYAKAHKAVTDEQVEIRSLASDPRQMVVHAEGGGDPGTYYFIDFKNGGAKRIGDERPNLPTEWVAEKRPITYKAADGLEIHGYLTLPPGREAKALPLIVLAHGGPQARDALGFDWWAQAMASRGYAVLQANYRGSDGYGRAFIDKGHGQWGRKMQTDLSDGVRDLVGRGIVDPNRVCIVGGSYGGYAALAGASIDRAPYRCAAAVAGVSDLKRMLEFEGFQKGAYSEALGYWKTFWGDRASWDEISPYRQAAKVGVPVLLVHGLDDTVVPISQSRIMRDALKAANKPVDYVELPGEDHWLSSGTTRKAMLEAVTGFLLKNNPPE